jgi:hypothetical protein|tara:strand:+ start:440 stop:1399 length:960 start_codon:yes stop_codon:yes gene_type:complete
MATSGNYTLTYNTNQIIEEAFDLIQIGQDGDSVSGDMYNRGRNSLNILLKKWEQQGIHLWTMKTGFLFLNKGQNQYNFGTANLANVYSETTTDATESIGQTIIAVTATSITGADGTIRTMTANDIIGIVTDDNDMHWSTVDSIIAGVSVTLDDALTVAAGSGSEVFWYTPSSFAPVVRMLSIRRKDTTDYEIPIILSSKEDYETLPNKAQEGTVIQCYYERSEQNGVLYTWNAPSSSKTVLSFSYERKIEIQSTTTNTFDLPEYWYDALCFNLANILKFKYGCSPLLWAEIKQEATDSLNGALAFDVSLAPIQVNIVRH